MKGIYKYTDLKTGNIIYVGKDSHIDKNTRYKAHLAHSNYEKQKINVVLQNNPDRYEYSVLYSSNDVSDDNLNMLETSFIERFNPKFNFTKGGEGLTGYKHTEETIKKMSKPRPNMSGENHPMWNKEHTKESKIKMSESRNTVGFLNVYKQKSNDYKKGFTWKYVYTENGKRKIISSVDIKKLEEKVKAKGLEWRKL